MGDTLRQNLTPVMNNELVCVIKMKYSVNSDMMTKKINIRQKQNHKKIRWNKMLLVEK